MATIKEGIIKGPTRLSGSVNATNQKSIVGMGNFTPAVTFGNGGATYVRTNQIVFVSINATFSVTTTGDVLMASGLPRPITTFYSVLGFSQSGNTDGKASVIPIQIKTDGCLYTVGDVKVAGYHDGQIIYITEE